jgi:transposase-like protein
VSSPTALVRRALKALFGGAVSKDTVSRVWRKVKADRDTWNARSLADEPVVGLILDGTVVDVRLDHKATAISLLASLACGWSKGAAHGQGHGRGEQRRLALRPRLI